MTSICILGMHRSGTSTITRAFNLLGVYLGEEMDLMIPLPDNPEGYWERPDIYYLQERMLTALKRNWATTSPLPENWHKCDAIRPLKEELAKLVKENFAGRSLWAWKDPRSCLLLPLWKDVLAELGMSLKIVFAIRSPLDVARSLEKRDGIPMDKGLGMWFAYTLIALKEINGLEVVFSAYDRFLDDWETELKKCADTLGITWPADMSPLRANMASFVRHDLRHSVSGLEELHNVKAPLPVIRLYSLLLDILSGTGALNSDAAQKIEDYYQEFLGYARFFDVDMATLADYRERFDEIANSPEALPKLVGLQKDLDMRTEWALQLNREAKALREQVAVLKRDVAELLPLKDSADTNLKQVLNSMSWKITKPLRSAHALLFRPKKDHQ